jgi:5-methylthioadenosine/S-adenosylhomocysteine deaminase
MTSRRALLKAGTGFAAGAAVVPLPPNAAVAQSQDSEAATLEHLLRADPNTRRILLKGGTIISMDPTVGDFAQGDVPALRTRGSSKKCVPRFPSSFRFRSSLAF